jgi:hypothetical protein
LSSKRPKDDACTHTKKRKRREKKKNGKFIALDGCVGLYDRGKAFSIAWVTVKKTKKKKKRGGKKAKK